MDTNIQIKTNIKLDIFKDSDLNDISLKEALNRIFCDISHILVVLYDDRIVVYSSKRLKTKLKSIFNFSTMIDRKLSVYSIDDIDMDNMNKYILVW